MKRTIKLTAMLPILALMTAGLLATQTPTSQAATARNGICETGEICFYFNSNGAGSLSDFTTSVGDYGTNPATCYVFKSAGAGNGMCIKNQTASVEKILYEWR